MKTRTLITINIALITTFCVLLPTISAYKCVKPNENSISMCNIGYEYKLPNNMSKDEYDMYGNLFLSQYDAIVNVDHYESNIDCRRYVRDFACGTWYASCDGHKITKKLCKKYHFCVTRDYDDDKYDKVCSEYEYNDSNGSINSPTYVVATIMCLLSAMIIF